MSLERDYRLTYGWLSFTHYSKVQLLHAFLHVDSSRTVVVTVLKTIACITRPQCNSYIFPILLRNNNYV